MRVTSKLAKAEHNRQHSSVRRAEKRPQWAEFDATAAVGPPKAGQWRASSRRPGRNTLEPGAALGNYALKRQATWGMSAKVVDFCYQYFMTIKQPQNSNQATSEDTPVAEAKPPSKWKKRAQRIAWSIHARYPNIIPDPYGEDIAYERKRDTEDNAKSTVDEGVSLRFSGVMVCEIFGPNEIETLFKGLEKLGWDRDRTSALRRLTGTALFEPPFELTM